MLYPIPLYLLFMQSFFNIKYIKLIDILFFAKATLEECGSLVPKSCTGKILHIDLSAEKTWEEDIPEEWYSLYIGGEGFGARYLYDNLKPHTDPLSEENKILFITGPLTDTKAPSSGRTVLMFKSPLTGTICASNVGGSFAPHIKRSGYDMIVIHGKAEALKYIYIHNDKVEFIDAEELRGKPPKETQEIIREKHNNKNIQIAAIGEAGEKLVKISSIMVDGHRAAGRGGGGAVMGSKNLKAVAVFGSRWKTEVAEPAKFEEATKKAINELFTEEFVKDELSKYGTPSFFDAMNLTGLVPFYNWKRSKIPEFNEQIGCKPYHDKLEVKPYACFNCPIACGRHTKVPEGKYKGIESGGPEYEAMAAFGSKTGVKDIYVIAAANYFANELGLDVISTGQVIATAMEWYEKGLIDKETADGLELEWGNGEAVVELVKKIGKREGKFAHLLGEGSLRAARTIGGEAIKYVMHVKGLEMAADEVRTSKGEAWSHMLSPRGADHLRPWASIGDAFGYLSDELGLTKSPDPLKEENKAWVKPLEELSMATNLLGVCLFTVITLAVKGETWTQLFNYATGFDFTLKDLFKASERVINLERLFNVREGFKRKDDYLPERFSKEPGDGSPLDQEKLLDLLYEIKGWDKEGIPTKEKLAELGLL